MKTLSQGRARRKKAKKSVRRGGDKDPLLLVCQLAREKVEPRMDLEASVLPLGSMRPNCPGFLGPIPPDSSAL